MKKAAPIALKEPRLSQREFNRRADQFLEKLQQELMPQHAQEFVAINMVSGEYVLGETPGEAAREHQKRWPKVLFFLCRVDGGPAIKFHGK